MEYLDCKGLSEAAEIHTMALVRVLILGCRLSGGDLRPALYELMRRRVNILAAYEECAAIYLSSLPKRWSGRDVPTPRGAPVQAVS